jgi:hypothetical protein
MQVGNADTFDDFYAKFEQQWLYIQKRTMGIIENWEQYLAEVSPANMYSGTMTDSLSKAVDGNRMQDLAAATAMYGYYAKAYFVI